MVAASQLHVLRLWDMGTQVPPVAGLAVRIAGAVQHERGNVDRGQDLPDVDVPVQPEECEHVPRAAPSLSS